MPNNPQHQDTLACLLTGVGGQGIVLVSRIIAQAYMSLGYECRTAETIGMSQRGGTVTSHIQVAPTLQSIPSSLIETGQADLIMAFEPGEALRAAHFLKPGGLMVCNISSLRPVTIDRKAPPYDGVEQRDYLRQHIDRFVELDGDALCAELGSPKVLNVIMLGAAQAGGALGVTKEQLIDAVRARVKPSFIELNLKALEMGITLVTNRKPDGRSI